MNYTTQSDGSVIEMSLQGGLKFDDNEKVRNLIKEAESSECKMCRLNLGQLDSIDSAGLGMFLLINDALVECGKTFELINAKDQVHKMLTISKFSEIMTIRE